MSNSMNDGVISGAKLQGRVLRVARKCALTFAAAALFSPNAFAVDRTWTGGATGTGTALNTAENWSPSGAPSSSGTDVMIFNGLGSATDLTFSGTGFNSGGNGGGLGGITLTSNQTGDISISKTDAGSTFRLAINAKVNIEAGAGAFSFGTTGSDFTLNLGQSAPVTFTNNSSHLATIGSHVSINASGGSRGQPIFDGTGDWLVSGAFTATINHGIQKDGQGTLTLTGANAHTGPTTVNAGVLNIRHASALGNTTTGGTQYGHDPYTTVANGAALELQHDTGMAIGPEALFLTGSGVGNNGALRNISGNNSWAGLITLAGNTTIQSDAGSLTIDVASGNAIVTTGTNQSRTLTLQGAGDIAINDSMVLHTGTGVGSLVKNGTGTVTLGGTNAYKGATTVNGGTLLINGDHSAATGAVTVGPNAALGGTGIIGGNTTIAGAHQPGASPGIQTFLGDLTYQNGGSPGPSVQWELIGNTTTNAPNPAALFDTIVVGGDLNFQDATSLELAFDSLGSTVAWTDSFWESSHLGTDGWLLYDVAGTTTGFENLSVVAANWLDSNGEAFDTLLTGANFSLFQDGSDIYLEFNVAAVPEPAMLVPAMVGLVGFAFFVGWRSRSRKATVAA